MNFNVIVHATPWFDRFLWAAGHTLWQGAIAAGVLWLSGRCGASAKSKHAVAWTALLCILAMFAVDFALAPKMMVVVNDLDQNGAELGAMGAAMWIAAMCALGLLIVFRFVALARTVRRSSQGSPASRVVLCSAITSPAAALNRVLIPPQCLADLDSRELAAVVAHEIAHLKRGDFWMNIIQNCLEATLIFNPFAWYVSARIRVEREHCCDDAAVEATGDAVAYGRALAKLAMGRELQPSLALAMADAQVSHRIRRLAGPKRVDRGRFLPAAAAVAASMMATGIFAGHQPPAPLLPTAPSPQMRTIRIINSGETSRVTQEENQVVLTLTSKEVY